MYPNVRGVGARYNHGVSVIDTMSQTSSGLGRSNGDGGRLYSTVLKLVR